MLRVWKERLVQRDQVFNRDLSVLVLSVFGKLRCLATETVGPRVWYYRTCLIGCGVISICCHRHFCHQTKSLQTWTIESTRKSIYNFLVEPIFLFTKGHQQYTCGLRKCSWKQCLMLPQMTLGIFAIFLLMMPVRLTTQSSNGADFVTICRKGVWTLQQQMPKICTPWNF